MTVSSPDKRLDYLDSVRVLACFMVILMHSPMPDNNAPGMFLSTISYLTAPCIGLFFMVSGALLLPVRTGMFTFLKKRFTKIIFPTLFWTAIYLAANLYYSESEINIARTICSVPFSHQGHGVLWFMYTLAGLYLLAPVLSGWLSNAAKREVEFILLLWTITLCFPVLSHFVDINTSNQGILYYFTGYAGYFILGYYLKKWPESIKWKILMPFVAISLVAPVVCKSLQLEVDFYNLFWYLSIFVVILTVAIWKFIDQYCSRMRLFSIAQYTFGIYLSHILVMRFFLWKTSIISGIDNYAIQTLVIAILTFIISLLLSMLIGRLSFAGYLIGISTHRRK